MSREEQEEAQKELQRIFTYLSPHIAPKDIPMVLWAFGLNEDTWRQVEMACSDS